MERPEQKFSKLLRLTWFDFTDTLWRNRNEIAHSGTSHLRRQEQESWATKLLWYLEHRHVISPHDQFAIGYTEEDIQTMPGTTRRQLVQTLERLEQIYSAEQRIQKTGQRTLRSYFGKKQQGPAHKGERG